MNTFAKVLILGLPVGGAIVSFNAPANDEMNSFRACLQRERDLIYNNAKLCAVGRAPDLSGGTEGEGIAAENNCPAKDYALSQVTDRCRKESFIAATTISKNQVVEKPKIDGGAYSEDFIDDGPSIKAPPTYRPSSLGPRLARVSADKSARANAAAGGAPGNATRGVGSSGAPKQKSAANSSRLSDDEDSDSTSATPAAKTKPADNTKGTSTDQPQAKVNRSKDDAAADAEDGSNRGNINQSSRSPGSIANVDADLVTCRNAQSKAQQCCGSPTACLTSQDRAKYNQLMSGGSDDEGLSDACDRLNRASALSGDLNGKVAALCTNNQYACQNTCSALVTKYQSLLDQCGDDCDNYSTYQDTIASLQSQQTSCASLAGKADSLSIQTLSSGQDQGLAAACQQKAGSSSLGSASIPSYGDHGSGGSSDYSSTTQTPGGQVNPRAQTAFASGEATAAQLSSGTAAPLGQLSTAGGDSGSGGTYYGQAVPGQAAATIRPIPNGGGGFGAGAATSPSNASARANPRAPGDSIISTDIDQGFRSGGYSETPGSDGARPPQPARSLASAGASDTIPSGYQGMDLKDFLPGGKYYRGRGMDAAARRSEINPKEDDIFQRISNKMQEKCKLGVLWRCRDE